MTIVRFYVAIKTALRHRDPTKKIHTHCEFLRETVMKKSGGPAGALSRFLTVSKSVKVVELRVSKGKPEHEEMARKIAKSLNINFNDLCIPQPNTLLAVLIIVTPLNVISTKKLVGENMFAKVVVDDFPHVFKNLM